MSRHSQRLEDEVKYEEESPRCSFFCGRIYLMDFSLRVCLRMWIRGASDSVVALPCCLEK